MNPAFGGHLWIELLEHQIWRIAMRAPLHRTIADHHIAEGLSIERETNVCVGRGLGIRAPWPKRILRLFRIPDEENRKIRSDSFCKFEPCLEIAVPLQLRLTLA